MAFPGNSSQGRGVTDQQSWARKGRGRWGVKSLSPERWNLLHHSRLSTLLQGATSVYSEDVTLNLMAQLGLEVTQFLLQARQRRENDGLRAQRTTGLDIVIKPEVTSQGDKSPSAPRGGTKPESACRAVPARPDPPQGDLLGIPTISTIHLPTRQQPAPPLYNLHTNTRDSTGCKSTFEIFLHSAL